MAKYESISKELEERIKEEKRTGAFVNYAFDESRAVRRVPNPHDEANVWRTAFVRYVDKIMNCPYYSRYSDKTQVFSFYRNDDLTRRAQHVQFVSRIARTIGGALNLNLDLIEAIALGHDIGHTPFGHAGERYLSAIYKERTGRVFNHNVHSVRVLDKIFPLNITLQTLDGIAAHNGELELSRYEPKPLAGFEELDAALESCYLDGGNVKKLTPSTLEGCVVRISDIIAYIGKDRQDAERVRLVDGGAFAAGAIGALNSEMINNLTVNIIENSYGKPYIALDKEHFVALEAAKREDYEIIYRNAELNRELDENVKPMTEAVYARIVKDLREGNFSSPVFRHHVNFLNRPYFKRAQPYGEASPDDIAVDYIASMTDDYFMDIYDYLFPSGKRKIKFRTYFG